MYNAIMDKEKFAPGSIVFRPITDEDVEFLYRVYASTREEEMAMTGWSKGQIEEFLRMQFTLQHTQYLRDYKNASFEIILLDKVPIGRLYVDRRKNEIRILDIAFLPEFRGQGIGSKILKELISEAEEKKLPLNFHMACNNPAQRLYERLGFEKKELRGMHYFMERLPAKKNDEP